MSVLLPDTQNLKDSCLTTTLQLCYTRNTLQWRTSAINYTEALSKSLNSRPSFFLYKFSSILLLDWFIYSALVWGSSVKHQPQKVGLEHVLSDEDVVQIVKKV